jgi:hypothetical protein
MSPFHDLGRRCGGPFPVESARTLPSSGLAPTAGRRTCANTELQVISLRRFVRLLSLGVIGLAGLLSRGVGGVVLVQGSATFRVSKVESRKLTGASRHAETSYSRALYAPPNHRDGVVHRTRADEEADDEQFDGKTTE